MHYVKHVAVNVFCRTQGIHINELLFCAKPNYFHTSFYPLHGHTQTCRAHCLGPVLMHRVWREMKVDHVLQEKSGVLSSMWLIHSGIALWPTKHKFESFSVAVHDQKLSICGKKKSIFMFIVHSLIALKKSLCETFWFCMLFCAHLCMWLHRTWQRT